MIRLNNTRVCITGGNGFLGKYVTCELENAGARVFVPRSEYYDLRDRNEIKHMMNDAKPDILIHLAANVGGIGYNEKNPADLFYDNAIMGIQLIHESYLRQLEKVVVMGTVCEYPKYTPAPFNESNLWDGLPEETNSAYGLAKKMLLVQGCAYRQQYNFNSVHLLLVNLYGPGDNFNSESSHVMPALIRKFAEAKESKAKQVVVWGTGSASREFLYVEDAAKAVILATQHYDKSEPINIGSGQEIKIVDLARMIADEIGYKGEIIFDPLRPDGQPRRCLDTSRAEQEFNFKNNTSLADGLKKTIQFYLNG